LVAAHDRKAGLLVRAEVPQPEVMAFLLETVAWVVPDEAFHFTVRRTFRLS